MHTKNEIANQAVQMKLTREAVKNSNLAKVTSDAAIFTGCGTSYYLAIAAARFFQAKTGIPAQAVPASDLFLHSEMIFSPNLSYTLFSISRSGTTSEIEIALDSIKNHQKIRKIAITCFENTPIHEKSDEAIVLSHINEKSVVMTQSFSNMLYAIQCYTYEAHEGDCLVLESMEQATQKQVDVFNEQVIELAQSKKMKQFIFLGSGAYNGLVKEATLKLKEMTQSICESYSSLEFRHGPISIVNDETVVVLLAQQASADYDKFLIEHIQKFGGTVIALGENVAASGANEAIELEPGFSDWDRLVLYMPYLQYFAYYRAIALGLNPDEPRNLTQVVKL